MSESTPYMLKIVENVLAFLRAGGRVTWDEWSRMDIDTRGAFVVANQRIRIEEAIRNGTATQGPEGVLDVYSEIDGGELRETLELEAAVLRAAAKNGR